MAKKNKKSPSIAGKFDLNDYDLLLVNGQNSYFQSISRKPYQLHDLTVFHRDISNPVMKKDTETSFLLEADAGIPLGIFSGKRKKNGKTKFDKDPSRCEFLSTWRGPDDRFCAWSMDTTDPEHMKSGYLVLFGFPEDRISEIKDSLYPSLDKPELDEDIVGDDDYYNIIID